MAQKILKAARQITSTGLEQKEVFPKYTDLNSGRTFTVKRRIDFRDWGRAQACVIDTLLTRGRVVFGQFDTAAIHVRVLFVTNKSSCAHVSPLYCDYLAAYCWLCD